MMPSEPAIHGHLDGNDALIETVLLDVHVSCDRLVSAL